MPHRGEEEGEAPLVLRHVGGFLAHLHHQHGILRRVEPVEGGAVAVELIAQHQHELAQPLPFRNDASPAAMLGLSGGYARC